MAKFSDQVNRYLLCVLFLLVIAPSLAGATTMTWSTTSFKSMAHGTDYTWKVANKTYRSDTRCFMPDRKRLA